MNKTFEVKRPAQILVGSFNPETNKHRCFIPVPLKLDWTDAKALSEAAITIAGDQHGSGVDLPCSIPGVTRHAVLVEVAAGYSGLPFGNWIVQYDYSNDEGTHNHQLFLAAELL